jgi:hypothetical protein
VGEISDGMPARDACCVCVHVRYGVSVLERSREEELMDVELRLCLCWRGTERKSLWTSSCGCVCAGGEQRGRAYGRRAAVVSVLEGSREEWLMDVELRLCLY